MIYLSLRCGPLRHFGMRQTPLPMTRLLLLNHGGVSVPSLVRSIETTGAMVEMLKPENLTSSSAERFEGVVASGGRLLAVARERVLSTYSSIIPSLERPFLGICLGMKILG